ncbi:M23 family metallopeptidase [Variovorax arabinosiphilus]|uniref:M23 family metallopeptidase n=1 Tax=Variovorax arabinosiphilus TaxID=3053498 RepID=UPI002574AC30|nr:MULTISPECIES: M23 family metallopeptidase [unclassified Variovorax]MDM0123407.1 M23 family metallopeptidase [Variovorax sp. J2L1-78]MDM0132466.1 M23 family metallopeptidase [Variovorax sp. J2L1-63]MDM0231001.1 M23 family metallopeptidase [Variovorax sp. J2R1-6]
MIISPPFLPTSDADDLRYVAIAMPDSVDIAPGSGGAPAGSYPLTTAMTWHNGLHIQAPRDAQNQHLPVRAIADGTVIFKRAPKPANNTATDAQNYNPYSNTPAWTDNGIVIVRHTTDIGATGNTPTTVTYYSAYMHLSSIDAAVEEKKPIWRKDVIGKAGQIYGRDHQIHFEICLNPDELQKLMGVNRPITWGDPATAPTADGRTDAVFGSLYVYLPAGTPIRTAAPTSHLRNGGPATGASATTGHFVPNTLQAAQWVEVRYQQGNGTVSSYRASDGTGGLRVGDPIGQPHPERDFEYNLYTEANKRHTNAVAGGATSSSPSGWYELLRFGRNLGPDPLPADAAHWREIPAANGTVWADLNAPGAFKFSDADFPAFKDWQCFGDDPSPENQRCDSTHLKRTIRDPLVPESILERKALARRLSDSDVRRKLERAICSFPTEWDKTTITDRYEWLKVDEEFRVEEGDQWNTFKAHAESISFDDLPQDYKDAIWHIHPRTFIRHMRQCGWLSENEAYQLFPKLALRKIGQAYVNERVTPDRNRLRNHLISINAATRKYCITSPVRLAAFYGNSMQETQWFRLLEEGGGQSARYAPWHGRGFLQLTWPDNYIKYAEFKGMNIAPQLKTQLAAAARTANQSRSNLALLALEGSISLNLSQLRLNVAAEPPFHMEAADSAGAYWAWTSAGRSADPQANFMRQAASTFIYYTHRNFGNVAGTVNVGHPSTSYSTINGIEARFQCFTSSTMVLMDLTQFPDGAGQMQNEPDGWTRRLP